MAFQPWSDRADGDGGRLIEMFGASLELDPHWHWQPHTPVRHALRLQLDSKFTTFPPGQLPHGATHCRNDSAGGWFIRWALRAAGKPPQDNTKRSAFGDAKWEAQTTWARFVACAKALPPDLARPLWEAAQAQAAAALTTAGWKEQEIMTVKEPSPRGPLRRGYLRASHVHQTSYSGF
jgi:hypothetical protein